jgi:hypothetical protein
VNRQHRTILDTMPADRSPDAAHGPAVVVALLPSIAFAQEPALNLSGESGPPYTKLVALGDH